ncbi:hypothetical protein PO909_031714 [Leuciscus waleckii]
MRGGRAHEQEEEEGTEEERLVPASIDDINELKILRGLWEWRSVFLLITEYEARVPMRVTFPQVNARYWRMRASEVCGISGARGTGVYEEHSEEHWARLLFCTGDSLSLALGSVIAFRIHPSPLVRLWCGSDAAQMRPWCGPGVALVRP